MIGRARSPATAEPVHGGGPGAPGIAGDFASGDFSPSLVAQLLGQNAKPGDKIAIHQIDELRDSR